MIVVTGLGLLAVVACRPALSVIYVLVVQAAAIARCGLALDKTYLNQNEEDGKDTNKHLKSGKQENRNGR